MLQAKEVAIAIAKEGRIIFETRSHKISGFLEAIDSLGPELEGASVADRVAGKAVALLCVYAGIKAIYACVLSEKAKAVFDENGIICEWSELVENILDSSKSSLCPFEEKAMALSNSTDAYHTFRELEKKLRVQA